MFLDFQDQSLSFFLPDLHLTFGRKLRKGPLFCMLGPLLGLVEGGRRDRGPLKPDLISMISLNTIVSEDRARYSRYTHASPSADPTCTTSRAWKQQLLIYGAAAVLQIYPTKQIVARCLAVTIISLSAEQSLLSSPGQTQLVPGD